MSETNHPNAEPCPEDGSPATNPKRFLEYCIEQANAQTRQLMRHHDRYAFNVRGAFRDGTAVLDLRGGWAVPCAAQYMARVMVPMGLGHVETMLVVRNYIREAWRQLQRQTALENCGREPEPIQFLAWKIDRVLDDIRDSMDRNRFGVYRDNEWFDVGSFRLMGMPEPPKPNPVPAQLIVNFCEYDAAGAVDARIRGVEFAASANHWKRPLGWWRYLIAQRWAEFVAQSQQPAGNP